MQDFSQFCCCGMGELGRGALDRKETTEVGTLNLMRELQKIKSPKRSFVGSTE